MIYAAILFTLITLFWLFIKNPLSKFVLTLIMILLPAMTLVYLKGYAYAASFSFLVILYTQMNNFRVIPGNRYKKFFTSIPIMALFWLMAYPVHEKTKGLWKMDTGELITAVSISMITIFIAALSLLLALRRTKGEKMNG